MQLRPHARTSSDAVRTFSRKDRVLRRADFERAQREARRVHTPHFVMMAVPSADVRRRLGITVSRKVGDAVRRNRVKRVLREVFRLHRELFPAGADVVVVARAGAAALGFAAVLDEVRGAEAALRRAARERREGQG